MSFLLKGRRTVSTVQNKKNIGAMRMEVFSDEFKTSRIRE